MNLLGKILSAPARIVGTAAGVVNGLSEAVTGDNFDIFEVEDAAHDLADDIEDCFEDRR